jgi:hypothetical protein
MPFDEIDTMLQGHPTVQVEVILHVTEEAFNATGCGGYFGIRQIVEHTGLALSALRTKRHTLKPAFINALVTDCPNMPVEPIIAIFFIFCKILFSESSYIYQADKK